jgi:hypothetical protein
MRRFRRNGTSQPEYEHTRRDQDQRRVIEKSQMAAALEQHRRQHAEKTGDQQVREMEPPHYKLFGYEVHYILLSFAVNIAYQ